MPNTISTENAKLITTMLLDLFSDHEESDLEVLNWMSRKNIGLDNRRPVEVLSTHRLTLVRTTRRPGF